MEKYIKGLKDCPQKKYLLYVKQKEREARERYEIHKKYFEIRKMIREVGIESENFIKMIIDDFKDLTPCLEKAIEYKEMKEKSGDYKDERIYNLVKKEKGLDKHPIISKFKEFSNLDLDVCIEWCKMGNYHFETIKKLFLNI